MGKACKFYPGTKLNAVTDVECSQSCTAHLLLAGESQLLALQLR